MIEDLTHQEFLELAGRIPNKFTMDDIERYAQKISVEYLLNRDDSVAAFFIAASINQNVSVREYERVKSQRIAEVIKLREKKLKEECVKG